MQLTIITINYNNKEGLADTMNSVLAQTFKDFEYIIIDGGSSDGSVDVIEAHGKYVSYWVSEPDKGVYNAMNKGIKKATGEYLLFLNSGDYFVDNDVLSKCFSSFNFDEDIIYGDLIMEKKDDFTFKKEYPNKLTLNFFYRESLPHPASFIKMDLFKRVGYYNETLKIVSDWEFWLKAIFFHSATYRKIPITISHFDLGGLSSNDENKAKVTAERELVYSVLFPNIIDDYRYFNKIYEEYSFLKESLESSRIIKILRKLGLTKL